MATEKHDIDIDLNNPRQKPVIINCHGGTPVVNIQVRNYGAYPEWLDEMVREHIRWEEDGE